MKTMMKPKLMACMLLMLIGSKAMAQQASYSGTELAKEGAWCWFADPRAMRVKEGKTDAAYVGYIDNHGAVRALQLDYRRNTAEEVLVRSYFQPDDHNNPTFLALSDGRIMIFYTRHTDEPRFYYRISRRAGDITSLGDEKIIEVKNNTTYPSPFILSDDPQHIYLCWRGIGWHPTIAKLSMPDANDDLKIEWGPYQMVQSTGARPYAKYQSNGKDKIYLSYTTGHPDNELPNWLYFNTININAGGEPQLCDVNGKVLSTISEGKFNVFKRDNYKQQYPLTVIDSPENSRCWVFQITTDKEENPVVAFVRISPDKKQHEYYYARWIGGKWRITDIADAGKWFHQSPQTENCYSAGMAIDPDDVNTVYCSLPTKNQSGKEVYEIWKYTLNDAGVVTTKEAITWNSEKNNMRPYVLPGSVGSDLRVVWMNGDYYYWMKCSRFPEGYPTRIMGKLDSGAALSISPLKGVKGEKNMKRTRIYPTSLNSAEGVKTVEVKGKHWCIDADVKMDAEHYTGVLLRAGNMEYGVDEESLKPYIKIGGKTYFSANKLGNSDDWTKANGTDGKWYFKKLNQFHLSIVRQGKSVTVYRDGLIDIKN